MLVQGHWEGAFAVRTTKPDHEKPEYLGMQMRPESTELKKEGARCVASKKLLMPNRQVLGKHIPYHTRTTIKKAGPN